MSARKYSFEAGDRYSRLTFEEIELRPVLVSFCRCRCECGKTVYVKPSELKHGAVRSCGCLNKETQRRRFQELNGIHGNAKRGKKTKEYGVWTSIKARCYYPKHSVFEYYGGRGITMCDIWRISFETFLKDMGPMPSPKHTIERNDSNGNYEPGNCKWATNEEQVRNRRSNLKYTISGVTLCLKDWATKYGVNYKSLHHQVSKNGKEIEAAIRAATKEEKDDASGFQNL